MRSTEGCNPDIGLVHPRDQTLLSLVTIITGAKGATFAKVSSAYHTSPGHLASACMKLLAGPPGAGGRLRPAGKRGKPPWQSSVVSFRSASKTPDPDKTPRRAPTCCRVDHIRPDRPDAPAVRADRCRRRTDQSTCLADTGPAGRTSSMPSGPSRRGIR